MPISEIKGSETDISAKSQGAFAKIRKFFAPAPHISRLAEDEIEKKYPRYRWSVLESTFIGYGAFYLVRNNIPVVTSDMATHLGYSITAIGAISSALAISYGIGKFFMGMISDRSNARKFMAFGLLATAILNILFGSVSNYWLHLSLWVLNGFVQGMGWSPCGRLMGHWFSVRERGTIFSIWNTSHNFGGAIAGVLSAEAAKAFGWQNAFYVPAFICIIGAAYLYFRLKDTPQAEGLPPIEEYKNDFTEHEKKHGTLERELGTRELVFDYVLKNKYIWLLAFANLFAYIVRYSMLIWGPTYLREVRGTNITGGGIAVFVINFGGVAPTILLGMLSDKIGGRRGMIMVFCMLPIALAFAGIILNTTGLLWIDMLLLFSIGFLIYPVINLVTIVALDLTSKKAIGTAAGFVGLFGYIGTTLVGGVGWMRDHFTSLYGPVAAWNIILWSFVGCAIIATALFAFTWNLKPKA